jgi:hypothetical protein
VDDLRDGNILRNPEAMVERKKEIGKPHGDHLGILR